MNFRSPKYGNKWSDYLKTKVTRIGLLKEPIEELKAK